MKIQMKATFAAAFSGLLLLAGMLKSSADTVELNGLTSLFGNKMAFLVLYQPAQTKPISFTLSEGESQFGIKLIGVDVGGHRVQVEQCGLKSFLHLCSTPDLTAPADGATELAADKPVAPDEKAIASYLSSVEVDRIKSGIASVNFSAAGGDKKNAGTASDPGSSKDSGNPINSGPASSQKNQSDEVWYQESLIIEQNRIATVKDVLAGDLTPWPRTPLTPAGTPAKLIGKETFFSNHIPHYVVPGYLNPLVTAN